MLFAEIEWVCEKGKIVVYLRVGYLRWWLLWESCSRSWGSRSLLHGTIDCRGCINENLGLFLCWLIIVDFLFVLWCFLRIFSFQGSSFRGWFVFQQRGWRAWARYWIDTCCHRVVGSIFLFFLCSLSICWVVFLWSDILSGCGWGYVHEIEESVMKDDWFFGVDYLIEDFVEERIGVGVAIQGLLLIEFLLWCAFFEGHFGSSEDCFVVEGELKGLLWMEFLDFLFEVHVG